MGTSGTVHAVLGGEGSTGAYGKRYGAITCASFALFSTTHCVTRAPMKPMQRTMGAWHDGCNMLDEPLKPHIMIRWVITFLIIALVAGVLGFGVLASAAAGIAKIVFYIFLVLLVISLLFGGSIWKKA